MHKNGKHSGKVEKIHDKILCKGIGGTSNQLQIEG